MIEDSKIVIKSHEVDHKGLLKPFSFLNYAQELANRDAAQLGFGYDNIRESGVLWVLSRINVKFIQMPKWRDELLSSTWHKGVDKLFGLRDFLISKPDGSPMITATSSWLIIDNNSRKIRRIESVIGDDFTGGKQFNAIESPAPKILSIKEGIVVKNHTVAYSDLDINGHTNNAKYIEWIVDSLPWEYMNNNTIKEFTINFNQESIIEDTIEIKYKNSQDGHYFEGVKADKSIFTAKLIF